MKIFKGLEKYKDILKLGVILITFVFLLYNLPFIWGFVLKVFRLFTPFIIGLAIAFLVNPMVKSIKKLSLKFFKAKCPNWFSVFLAYLLFFSMIVFSLVIIVPQIFNSILLIFAQISSGVDIISTWVNESHDNNDVYIQFLTEHREQIEQILESIVKNISPIFTNIEVGVKTFFNTTSDIIFFCFNILFGTIISVYMLLQKNKYIAQIKKCIFALFDDKKARSILNFCKNVDSVFTQYVLARVIDSFIIGIICFVGCCCLGLDNALLIAIIVGFTNVIPYFGPFIGAVPSALIVLLQSPLDMIVFIVFIIILQQFDGNILGPKLLGNSLGLSSLWIIFAIILMTGLFGVVGTIIGVPIFSIIYMVIKKYIDLRLTKKGKSNSLEDYIKKEDF